ncbi:MAG: glutaredoxin 3 [Polyangiaceae bacterium]
MAANVVMYRTRFCPYCIRANFLLKGKHVSFQEIDVSGDLERRAWLREATGQHTVPQIFINDRSIGGFSELSALDHSGQLDRLLAEEPQA